MIAKNHQNEIVEIIQGAETFLLATHVFPDGDALGSLLALGEILESLGKKVIRYAEEEVNYLYQFLPCGEKVVTNLSDLGQVDCVISLDCGDKYRLGKGIDELLAVHPFIVLDHHCGHKNFGDFEWVDPTMASTGSLVYELANLLGAEISYKAAYCLYTAIVSDTGSFKYASTTADTFKVAGELVAKGVKPEEVAGHLFDNFTESRLQLLQMVLASLELAADGKIALITATQEMFLISGSAPCDTESFINFPRSLDRVKVAVFFKENTGALGVSLRSKGTEYDVAAVAREFGGGGHCNAAGFKIREESDIEAIKKRLLDFLLPLVN